MPKSRSLRLVQIPLAGAIIGVMLLLSACGGSGQLQQQASQARSQLAQQIQHAKDIGVPLSSIQPIIQQEQKLNNNGAPFSPFSDTPDNSFYKNQTSSYQQLLSQLQQEVAIVTGQDQGQAQQDLQDFDQALTSAQALKVGDIQDFSLRYTTDENRFTAAQYPKDYVAISNDAVTNTTALNSLGSADKQLLIFENTINQMKQADLDVTAMQTEYTSDLGVLDTSTTSVDFNKLSTMLDAQYQLAVVNSIQSLPYVGAAKLAEFQADISDLKTYGMDASPYVRLYNADKTAMAKATTIAQYLAVSNKINSDMASMQDDLTQGEASYLITELNNEANAWGNAHLYHDKTDGQNYILDSAYTMNGIGYWLQLEVGWSYTPSDYQSVVTDDQNELFNFQMMQQDYADSTPYNQVHKTDLEMMQHYPSLQHGTVIMVNMTEEALRFYDNGKLVRAFQVTTGQVARPTLPGVWSTYSREAPTVFKSDDPPSSPYYYPPTPINYAIGYHWDGFFVHDAWWRSEFGPGTQFPHIDPDGDSFAYVGSHGCVNVQEQDMAWLYAHTDWTTQIVIY